ncbi:MAG: YqcC family protein [Pseudomonadota bacterium]|uniref:YqcC family protein n=1 Tax=Gallaecimonas pentaromativorans TaxID=584787 RepID=UPI00067F43EA|nr:YqcC family protein [Gallaecimonas pentaromativorans]MED5524474.1 YqcC family protein [Pseudomonadota bacterium]
MSDKHQQALLLLEQIEMEMRLQKLWAQQHPGEQALASTEPFAVDTLDFEQWVQFIYLPKLKVLIGENQAPSNVSVCPMAEESWRHHGSRLMPLLELIADLDELLSGKRVRE